MKKILVVLFLAAPLAAAVPNRITYQGRLMKSGLTAAGTHSFQVCFVPAVPSACVNFPSVTVPVSGDFTLLIDVPAGVDFSANAYQLQLTVDSQPLSPADEFTAVPYALAAATAAYAATAASAASALSLANPIASSQIQLTGTSTLDSWQSTTTPSMIRASRIEGSLPGQWAVGSGSLSYDGKVGIGTTAPAARLSILDPLMPSLQLRRDAANEWYMTASQAGTNRLGLRSGGNSDADEKLTVLANGNVGVGTTAPTEKLTVAGRIADASGYVAPVGAIMLFAGATAPTGWLICDGRNLNRSDYPDLFAAIGTTWGNGNGGGTAFNIPDLRNRSPFGKSDSGTFAVLGATGGTETHTHTQESHSHSIWPNGGAAAANANPVQMGNPILTDSKAPNINTSSNVPPFAVVNYIVKY